MIMEAQHKQVATKDNPWIKGAKILFGQVLWPLVCGLVRLAGMVLKYGLGLIGRLVDFLCSDPELEAFLERPTLNQYLAQYPHCKTSRGIRCVSCNSSSIRNFGLEGPKDSRRIFICNHCNATLYRTEHDRDIPQK